MVIRYDELIHAAEVVAEKEQMKITLKYSFAGATFTTCTTLLGGVVGGPLGLAVGGTLGGIASAMYSKGKFKPVWTIIRDDLTEEQKLLLAQHIENALKDFQITDLAGLMLLINSDQALFHSVVTAIKFFLQNDMKLQLTV